MLANQEKSQRHQSQPQETLVISTGLMEVCRSWTAELALLQRQELRCDSDGDIGEVLPSWAPVLSTWRIVLGWRCKVPPAWWGLAVGCWGKGPESYLALDLRVWEHLGSSCSFSSLAVGDKPPGFEDECKGNSARPAPSHGGVSVLWVTW